MQAEVLQTISHFFLSPLLESPPQHSHSHHYDTKNFLNSTQYDPTNHYRTPSPPYFTSNTGKPVGGTGTTNELGHEVFGAGVGLMIAGSLLSYIQQRFQHLWTTVTERSTTEVVVYSDAEVYDHVSQYLAAHPEIIKQETTWVTRLAFIWYSFQICVLSLFGWHKNLKRDVDAQFQNKPSSTICKAIYSSHDVKNGSNTTTTNTGSSSLKVNKPELIYVPNGGNYEISFQGTTLHLVADMESTPISMSGGGGDRGNGGDKGAGMVLQKRSIFTIIVDGRDDSVIRKFLQTAVDEYFDKFGDATNIFMLDRWQGKQDAPN
jgi:hypothetical protein